MTWARAITSGWVVTDQVPGPGVDEFAGVDEVTAALAGPDGAGDNLLAVQHPHRTPAALAAQGAVRARSLPDSLPSARRMLDRLLATAYRPVRDVVAPYRVSGPDGTAVGVLCLVDPAAVDRAGQTRIRHSEQVYPDVVAERAAVLAGLGRATSAAMLVPVATGGQFTSTVLRTVDGPAAVTGTDPAGRTHELWLTGPGPAQDALLTAVRAQPLLVADGNHRLAATVAAGASGLLALVTSGPELRIGAIHRALVGTGLTRADLVRAWQKAGRTVSGTGRVLVETADGDFAVDLPKPAPGEPTPRIDHGVVERALIAEALGIDPEGPHLRPLPEGAAPPLGTDAVLRIKPVPLADVLAVHRQGRRMPRKSTYFTPKPRSGLLLASL
jgi:hypothetical protein